MKADVEKAPNGMEAPKGISQEHCTTEVWTVEDILRNEG